MAVAIVLLMAHATKVALPITKNNDSKITVDTKYVAGDLIVFKNVQETENSILFLSSSYGSTILYPSDYENSKVFQVPSYLSKKAGWVYWKHLLSGKVKEEGTFQIVPTHELSSHLETYVGPRSLKAGGVEPSMLVAIPCDKFGNLLPEGSPLAVSKFVDGATNIDSLRLKNGIAVLKIPSMNKAGRIFLSTTAGTSISKERIVDVGPSEPVDFTISLRRQHMYADGNETMDCITSQIKDSFGNIVADGTLVSFQIIDASNSVSMVTATTVNGVATAQLLHPTHRTNWMVKANVSNFATSNAIETNFESATLDFEARLIDNNTVVEVGPIKSFLGQLIPDGTQIVIRINKQSKTILTENGMARLKLAGAMLPKNEPFDITIQTMGLEKRLKGMANER